MVLFHGTNGDNILRILATRHMEPNAQGEIFFAKYDWTSALMHGADRLRKAAFVLKVEIDSMSKGTKPQNISTQGVASTLLLKSDAPVRVRVIELIARKRTAEGFVVEHVTGENSIRAYLQRPQSS